jgi:hypothetical protein
MQYHLLYVQTSILWVLFKFASKERLLEQIYNEISSLLSIEKFEELYDYATKDNKCDALIIDNQNRVNKDLCLGRIGIQF